MSGHDLYCLISPSNLKVEKLYFKLPVLSFKVRIVAYMQSMQISQVSYRLACSLR